MQKSYGKAISAAARVKAGQALMELRLNKDKAKLGREALERGSSKFPCPCKVITVA
jgi:ribosomal protein L16/L10AE